LTHNPHIHALATEGLVCSDDIFFPVPTIDALLLEHAFSRRVFNLLLRHQKTTPDLVQAMHSWKHSGFSAHTAVRVLPEEPKTAERVLRYLLRPPVANARTRDASQVEIIYTDTLHDSPQALTLEPLDFLARATSHIPQPRQHQLRYYGAYAPRARSARRKRLTADSDPSPNQQSPRDDSPAARARRLSWAKLLRRVRRRWVMMWSTTAWSVIKP